MGLQKEWKNMALEELKQVWSSADAVAILEHWPRRFHTRHLIDCDMEFLNLEDTCPKLPVALIFIYKRSTHAKEKKSH